MKKDGEERAEGGLRRGDGPLAVLLPTLSNVDDHPAGASGQSCIDASCQSRHRAPALIDRASGMSAYGRLCGTLIYLLIF